MTSHLLKLVFPQWQGSGDRRYTYHGARLIRDRLLKAGEYEEVPVNLDDIQLENGIKGHGQILNQLKTANEIVGRSDPEKIFLIGGDCGTELAPISYLNKRYGGDLAVVWFDAHGDLNSPATSVTHNFHGMPLRCLLGDGDESLLSHCSSLLTPSQVIMAGTRELDPAEEVFIKEKSLTCASVEDMKSDMGLLVQMITSKGYRNVYAHIDLDVLYPDKYPWVQCPTEGGLDAGELMALLRDLKEELNLVGVSMLELRPAENMDICPLQELTDFCGSL